MVELYIKFIGPDGEAQKFLDFPNVLDAQGYANARPNVLDWYVMNDHGQIVAAKPDEGMGGHEAVTSRICSVEINAQGLNIKSERIISIANWGTTDDPDWYVELIDLKGEYRYYKQKYDGGTIKFNYWEEVNAA